MNNLCLQPHVQTRPIARAALLESVGVGASVMPTAGTVVTAAATSTTYACSVSNLLQVTHPHIYIPAGLG